MRVIYVPISDRDTGLRRFRASVPTIAIKRSIEARKLAVRMLVGLNRGRWAGGVAADVTRVCGVHGVEARSGLARCTR